MLVHFIWIGDNEVPPHYIKNFQKCVKINEGCTFKVWKNDECFQLLESNGLFEYWSTLTFICKCNLLKYLILDKFGGIYSDFDITWNRSFIRILNDLNYTDYDMVLTAIHSSTMNIDNLTVPLMDDPFIYSKPKFFGACIDYCQNRRFLYNDGDLYMRTRKLETHKLEPIGPFGLTEWIYKFKIKANYFFQDVMLDRNTGVFGFHEQNTNWNYL